MALLQALFGGRAADFEQAFGAADLTSDAMRQAIAEWYRLYFDAAPTKESDPAMRLAYTIVGKLGKAVFSEYGAELAGKGEKARGLRAALGALGAVKGVAMQHALIGGECLLKPVLRKLPPEEMWPADEAGHGDAAAAAAYGGFDFVVVQRPNYCVLAVDETGGATSYGTAEQTLLGRHCYTLLEKRSVNAQGFLTIESRLYCADGRGMLGREVPLASLPKYAGLVPVLTLPVPMFGTGLVPLVMPMQNCVDGSPAGVSVYAAAAGAIAAANRLEAQLNREFRNAASRVIASADMLRTATDGRPVLGDELFTALDDDPQAVGITIFSPEIRDGSFLRRKNDYLRTIENIVGIKRGILSEVEACERTATEITSSEGDYHLTIHDLQEAWTSAVHKAMAACDVLGQVYLGWDKRPAAAPVLEYGDGLLHNVPGDVE